MPALFVRMRLNLIRIDVLEEHIGIILEIKVKKDEKNAT